MAGLVAGCGPSNDAPTGRQGAAQTRAQPAAVVAVARGKVEVEGGLLELSPATAGMVQQIAVEEGQSVKRGQLLLRLADETAQADLGVAESELALAQARHKSRLARLPQLRQSLERWRAAEHADAADRQSVDEAAQALRDAEAEVALSQAEARVAQRKLEQLRALQKRHELRAPEAAVVARLNTAVGSQAQPGLTALVLLPARPLQVRAEINESFASAVKPGMKATVVLDGDGSPAATLPEARVARISPVYGLARLQEDQQRGPVRVVESVLRFEQPPSGLRVGQNVRVQFHE
ncbi:efflux RND transporter periplasmic adaptor subunit [Comamonas composti]|uniref:efflux RND transporter periplasmic adaptor subunit n=1 Tax=Comamonas composti TaxID=408558 RepID=UPI000684914D